MAYAQSALAPWRDRDDVPVDLVVVQATVIQSQHRFGEASRCWSEPLARQPEHVQAGLTLSTVRIVRGDLPGARRACEPFAAQVPEVARLCRLQVDGLTGAVEGTWPELRALGGTAIRTLRLGGGAPGREPDAAWDAGEAERGLARAAAVSGYLYDALALVDAFLSLDRPADALRMLEGFPPSDAVLLRRFRALDLWRPADAAALRARLEERLAAAPVKRRLHARERALFHFGRTRMPYRRRWAVENFALQKEPIDLRIAAEPPCAAGMPACGGAASVRGAQRLARPSAGTRLASRSSASPRSALQADLRRA